MELLLGLSFITESFFKVDVVLPNVSTCSLSNTSLYALLELCTLFLGVQVTKCLVTNLLNFFSFNLVSYRKKSHVNIIPLSLFTHPG